MKFSYFILCLLVFTACNQKAGNTQQLQAEIDSLKNKLDNTYKPGFGEFMSSIQVHHNKLWFAGQNQNWKLAEFEVHEIMETIEDLRVQQAERKESQSLNMLEPALDSVNYAIQHKDLAFFKSSYDLLTNTCNKCHRSTDFEFNVVKTPDTPLFSNQDFKGSQ